MKTDPFDPDLDEAAYVLVAAPSPEEMCNQIAHFMKQGFEPTGGVMLGPGHLAGQVTFLQSMWKKGAKAAPVN